MPETAEFSVVNPIHRSGELHRDAGTYYHSFYEDAGRIGTLFDAYSWCWQAVLTESLEASKLFVRTLIPPVHREPFLPVRVYETDYREGRNRLPVYGTDGLKYGDAYYYGHPSFAEGAGAVPLPDGVVDAELCCDLPVNPKIILLKNEHFLIRNGFLLFDRDLFELFPVRDEYGKERSVVLYLRGVSEDRHYLQDRLGFLLQTQGDSAPPFKEFNNLVLDCIQEGTASARFPQILCRIFDIPCTRRRETVQCTGETEELRWLATDKQIYTAPRSASFLFRAGETLRPGTILTDAVTGTGMPHDEDAFLFLERRFLGKEYSAGLAFPDKECNLEVLPGVPYPVFPVSGLPEDVRRFRDALDDRAEGPLFPASGRINPAKFLYENALYPRFLYYEVQAEKTGEDRLPVSNTRLLRALLPPGVLFSLFAGIRRQITELFVRAEIVSEAGVLMNPITVPVSVQVQTYPAKPC